MWRTAVSLSVAMAPLLVASQSIHPGCVMQHCRDEAARAVLQPTFMQMTLCEQGCTKVYKADTTPEKLHYQNCTTKCALTYETKEGDEFLACAMNNFCVGFPPIPGSCPYRKEHVQPGSSLASLSGEFWQERGRNGLWDCYPCQHIRSMFLSNDTAFCSQTVVPGRGPVKAPCWSYTYSYDLYLNDGSTKNYGQTWQLPGDVPPGEPIEIYYDYQGTLHNETWYIMQQTETYTIVNFCSYMFNWVNVGGIVWVRPGHELTEHENSEIRALYKEKLDVDYDSFCYDTHGPSKCQGRDASAASRATPRAFRHAVPGQLRPVLTPEQLSQVREAAIPLTV